MISNPSRLLLAGAITTVLAACGGGQSLSSPQSGNVSMLLSDASTQDWCMIGVDVLSIALVPQGGGASVPVYTAPAGGAPINLVDLDSLSDLIGNVPVQAGTYTGAVVTISANPGDVMLTAALDPEAGFAATPGAAIAPADIQIQHVQGTAPNLTTTVNVNFVQPVTVLANQNTPVMLDFDLAHPAFIVGHVPPAAAGTTIWAVNFDGPVRHHPVKDLAWLVLRHMYGEVTAVAATDLTITKEFPKEPVPVGSPETPVMTSLSLQIQPDIVNGTLVYDVDQKTVTPVTDFTTDPSLASGKQVRIAARYQSDGSLVATRIWVSSSFSNVWVSPEGHVLHVDPVNDVITVQNEDGTGIPVKVDANTKFFYRAPKDPTEDSNPIGQGPTFLADHDIVRGFKVHTSVDVTSNPFVAQVIDIETARYDGQISEPTGALAGVQFTYTHDFGVATDDYTVTLPYISSTTPNGEDPYTGAPIEGYKWWYFAYPATLDLSISDWVTATSGVVNFGLASGPVPTYGLSYVTWDAAANPAGWEANASIVMPSLLPLGMVADGLMGNGLMGGNYFTMTVAGGTRQATIDVSVTQGGATLVYQVDRTNGIVTVSQIDIATQAGLNTLTQALTSGTPVKVYGVPNTDGTSMTAYVLTYFTGTTMPSM